MNCRNLSKVAQKELIETRCAVVIYINLIIDVPEMKAQGNQQRTAL